jgi:hypothetical protein
MMSITRRCASSLVLASWMLVAVVSGCQNSSNTPVTKASGEADAKKATGGSPPPPPYPMKDIKP